MLVDIEASNFCERKLVQKYLNNWHAVSSVIYDIFTKSYKIIDKNIESSSASATDDNSTKL